MLHCLLTEQAKRQENLLWCDRPAIRVAEKFLPICCRENIMNCLKIQEGQEFNANGRKSEEAKDGNSNYNLSQWSYSTTEYDKNQEPYDGNVKRKLQSHFPIVRVRNRWKPL